MAWQQSDLDALRAAYIDVAAGAQKVRYADGREVTFTDPDKIAAAIRVVEANLLMQDRANSGLTRRRFGAFRSGT
jgi:hypothetical protein